MPQTPRRKMSLRERMAGQRQSTNIEDRRGQKPRPPADESDKYPMVYPYPIPISPDINDPVPTDYEEASHIPIWLGRRDLTKGFRAVRDWLVQQPARRKRGF